MLDTFPVIHTDRLDLIEISQDNLMDLFKLFSDEKVTRFYNLLPFKTEQDAQKLLDWFQNRFKDKLGIRWGIAFKDKPQIIGTIGFNNFIANHKANIGFDIQSDYWNQGLMNEALYEVINYGFNKLDINRIDAEVMQGNINSERLLAKHNFTKEGILRQWMYWNGNHYDMTMYS